MNMKKVLCIVLCLMLAVPAAFADTADTLPKLFARQLTGGNGVRGYVRITASGLAEWLEFLLPFTATDIQIRAIGEKQGEASDSIDDDDDWQVRFYAKNASGEEVGTTWLYGDPEGIYFQSELLPETVLSLPLEQTHLLYQLFKGEYSDLFFSFDPLDLNDPGANGNASAYEAVANVLGVSEQDWTEKWLPVLEKYFLQLDLWLTGFGDPSFLTGDTGAMKMSATYTIPAESLKAEAKYLIGQMLYDSELQALITPLVTMEQRITYLNPSMLYFYEACIDALDLQGDVILSREMSALGEAVSTTVALPLPILPESLTGPINQLAAELFGLPYTDLLDGMNRVSITQSGDQRTLVLSGEKRTVEISAVTSSVDEYTEKTTGTLRITPNVGVQENSLAASYSWSLGHQIWQDENYLNHDTTTFALKIEAMDVLGEDDPFRSSFVDFAPVGFTGTVDYRNNPNKETSPAQINYSLAAQLPDAEVNVEAVLRITTQETLAALSKEGAQDVSALTDAQKDTLLQSLLDQVVQTMANLSDEPAAEPALEPAAETAEPAAEPTTVPPAAE